MGENNQSRKPRLKRRWAATQTNVLSVPGTPAFISPTSLTTSQLDAMLIRFRIDEITQSLIMPTIPLPPLEGRSPSPEPVYDTASGKRLNTREQRTREKLEIERQHLINKALQINPLYRPPADYKLVSLKRTRKIYVPVDKYPDYNFIGLIIGPRGNTQKRMERESGAKISIRGKGSTKGKDWGKDGETEPLHVLITADTERSLRMAADRVQRLLKPMDEERNEHKKQQLRELALINGTLREQTWDVNEPTAEERTWEKADVKCEHCGEISHVSRDCPFKGTEIEAEYKRQKATIDKELDSFLSELGESGGSAGPTKGPPTTHAVNNAPVALLPAQVAYDQFMDAVKEDLAVM